MTYKQDLTSDASRFRGKERIESQQWAEGVVEGSCLSSAVPQIPPGSVPVSAGLNSYLTGAAQDKSSLKT